MARHALFLHLSHLQFNWFTVMGCELEFIDTWIYARTAMTCAIVNRMYVNLTDRERENSSI